MDLSLMTSLAMVIGALGFLFGFCAFVIKRFLVDKQYYHSDVQFLGRQVRDQFSNADSQAATEHVIYVEEDEREDHFVADDKSPTGHEAR